MATAKRPIVGFQGGYGGDLHKIGVSYGVGKPGDIAHAAAEAQAEKNAKEFEYMAGKNCKNAYKILKKNLVGSFFFEFRGWR